MTQTFSYATVGPDNQIYVPPYGLNKKINFLLKINPKSYEIKKIPIETDESFEKWQKGICVDKKIYFLPYNESRILIVDCDNDSIEYISVPFLENGKWLSSHLYKNKIISLPYGENNQFDHVLILDINTHQVEFKKLDIPNNDAKKWHTTQLIDNVIYGVPRGEKWDLPLFSYIIEFNCDNYNYKLIDMQDHWVEYDNEIFNNKKFTTLAKSKNKLYAPPYSENNNFDILLIFDQKWTVRKTNLKKTSRKYFSHTVASNNKIYFPPAGHDEEWSEILIIDPETDLFKIVDLGIKKESKKYFTGCENSQKKIYYIPRGGCACMPKDTWKNQGDLTEILVIDTEDDSFYTIDISEYFKEITTIEKYNSSLIIDDVIFAFPYGQNVEFQKILVFDTISEKVIKEINLNEIL
jgi:hypothetical protein